MEKTCGCVFSEIAILNGTPPRGCFSMYFAGFPGGFFLNETSWKWVSLCLCLSLSLSLSPCACIHTFAIIHVVSTSKALILAFDKSRNLKACNKRSIRFSNVKSSISHNCIPRTEFIEST